MKKKKRNENADKLDQYFPGAKDQSQNKETFRKNYGIEIKVPTVYVLDAKIYPNDFNYVVKIVKYAIPRG